MNKYNVGDFVVVGLVVSEIRIDDGGVSYKLARKGADPREYFNEILINEKELM